MKKKTTKKLKLSKDTVRTVEPETVTAGTGTFSCGVTSCYEGNPCPNEFGGG